MNDYVAVQVSANGGANWVEPARLAGPATDDDLQSPVSTSRLFDEQHGHPFPQSNSLGNKDRVYIDYVEIEYVPLSGGGAPPPPISNFTVRDEFNLTAYNNNDGTATWSSDWIEAGDGGSPSGGRITVAADDNCPNDGRCLEFDTTSGRSIARATDLSGAASATLSYAFYWDGYGEVVLEASSDGITWATLNTYTSSASGSEQFDLTPYKSANTHIRFRVTDGSEDGHLWVDDVQIEAADNTYESTGVGGRVLDQSAPCPTATTTARRTGAIVGPKPATAPPAPVRATCASAAARCISNTRTAPSSGRPT